MESHYDTMQVCRRWGHFITDQYDTFPGGSADRCGHCGSITIIACEQCNALIRGHYHVAGIAGGGVAAVPLNCHACGARYPWKWAHIIRNFLTLLVAPLKYLIDSFVSIFKK